MTYIDAYNLLFHLNPDADPLEPDRKKLIDALIHLPLILVFDAANTPDPACRHHKGRLEIVYTDPGESADQYILSELERHKATVVTDDRPLVRAIKVLGGEVLSTEAFLQKIAKKEVEKTPPLNRFEQARWLEIFEKKDTIP